MTASRAFKRQTNSRVKASVNRKKNLSRKGANHVLQVQARKQKLKAGVKTSARKAVDIFKMAGVLLVAVSVLGAGGWQAWKFYRTSEMLILRRIEIKNNQYVSVNEVRQLLALELGEKLFDVDLQTCDSNLATNPWIKGVDFTRTPAGKLIVRIEERQPVMLYNNGNWHGVASDGTLLPGMNPTVSDLPVLAGQFPVENRMESLLRLTRNCIQYHPGLFAMFSQISFEKDAFEVYLRNGKLRVLLPDNGKSDALFALKALLDQHGTSLELGETVDLRYEGYAFAG